MDEFALIEAYFTRPPRRDETLLGVGDDGALLDAAGPLCVVTDTLVAGRHFAPDEDAAALGHKALAVNLSDLAAMACEPLAFTLALTLPETDADWLEAFSSGLFALADEHRVDLVGGDTTRGPLSITISAFGRPGPAGPLRRCGAQAGDAVCLSGALGAAGAAWRFPERAPAACRQRLRRPQPRVRQGMALAGLASAAIDLSDGLAQDLGHLLRASGVGARIHYADIPAFEESAAFDEDQRRQCVLAGGDDYELCWTVAPGRLDACRETGACHRIGTVEAEPGLRIVDESGALIIAPHGFRHFST